MDAVRKEQSNLQTNSSEIKNSLTVQVFLTSITYMYNFNVQSIGSLENKFASTMFTSTETLRSVRLSNFAWLV